METKFIEVTNYPGGINWGKMMVGRFTPEEWARQSQVLTWDGAPTNSLVGSRGWTRTHVLVLDLQTGEGAIFKPGGYAHHDLNEKHRIWTCPMFEPFLTWLYEQDLTDLGALPSVVNIDPEKWPGGMAGKRGSGPSSS